MGARAISHLEEVSDEGIAAIAAAGVVAVLLPTTAYVLRLKLPPARKMINEGTLLHDKTLPFVLFQVLLWHLEVILILMLSACQWYAINSGSLMVYVLLR